MSQINFEGPYKFFTTRQRSAIENGFRLTERLTSYTEQAFGLRPDLVEVKRHTIIWSPPGAGKTFTVNQTIQKSSIKPVKFHGRASMNAFVIKMAYEVAFNPAKPIIVWIDDCDAFFTDSDALNVMKGVLDPDRNVLGWDVNMTSEIAKAEKSDNPQDQMIAEALRRFQPPGSVGVEIPTDQCRFIITTNKKLATKHESDQSQKKMDEHAVRDRVQWRSFDNTSDEAWGWMSSVILSTDVFKDYGFSLDNDETFMLLNTFHQYWDQLSANSMRTVMEAGSLLRNRPDSFADEFAQSFLQ
jgi:hypothetical protein